MAEKKKLNWNAIDCRNITFPMLVGVASALRSEGGENPEYDRALVELVCDMAGLPMDFKPEVAKRLGIKRDDFEERLRRRTV